MWRVKQGARYGLVNELSHALNAQADTPRSADTIYTYTNTGPCVDLWAPGVDVYSACGGRHRCGQYTPSSDSSYAWASGTSMAVPHVAGVAALYLSDHRTASAQEVKDALLATASLRKIRGRMLPGTVNRLLHWPFPTASTAAGACLQCRCT